MCIYVLDADGADGTKHMNGPLLRKMIRRYVEGWKSRCWRRKPARVRLIMDYERCLRHDESLKCFREHGCHALTVFPRSSQDLNPIENVWAHLRDKLEAEAPEGVESRGDFIRRLRAAVRWLNTTKKPVLVRLCRDMADRAQMVLDNEGGRIHR